MRSGRDTRGLGCAAAAVVEMARGVAGGSSCLSRRASGSLLARALFGSFFAFFRGRCEPQTPGVGPVGLSSGGWAGVVRRNGATKTRGVYYFCLLRGGDLDFSPMFAREWLAKNDQNKAR